MPARSSILRVATVFMFVVTLVSVARSAAAAECQLRNLGFAGVINDGRLVINAEIWNPSNNTQIGYLANATYCRVNTTYGSITAPTCQAWHSIATAAMLSAKRIYVTADACTVGNGVSMSNIGMFGLNN